MVINQFEVWLVNLDPTIGSEIRKTRPALIVSPNEMNSNLNTIIIAPMTSSERRYPTRVPLLFQKKKGFVALDQIRTVDKTRLVAKLGIIDSKTQKHTSTILIEMFSI
ncbi:MAG: type II toxin-antitoxin system PemK/MazF family toxin [Bacteroidota bacterium]